MLGRNMIVERHLRETTTVEDLCSRLDKGLQSMNVEARLSSSVGTFGLLDEGDANFAYGGLHSTEQLRGAGQIVLPQDTFKVLRSCSRTLSASHPGMNIIPALA